MSDQHPTRSVLPCSVNGVIWTSIVGHHDRRSAIYWLFPNVQLVPFVAGVFLVRAYPVG
jgi:hypothetical protein